MANTEPMSALEAMASTKPVAALEHSCRLVAMKRLNEDNILLTFSSEAIAAQAQAGQFVDIKAKAFLRRPFGIASVDRAAGLFSVGIKRKACGTSDFFTLPIGENLSILGPLGRGFALEGFGSLYIIGGGTGIYPLLFLLEEARTRGISTYVATGFREAKEILLEKEMRAVATDLCVATEVGERGGEGEGKVKGYAQAALELLWQKYGQKGQGSADQCSGVAELRSALCCCGPHLMMRLAATWAEERGLFCQVSMEERMACGIGLCRTCAVAVRDSGAEEKRLDYARCCVEGPVFPAEVIAW